MRARQFGARPKSKKAPPPVFVTVTSIETYPVAREVALPPRVLPDLDPAASFLVLTVKSHPTDPPGPIECRVARDLRRAGIAAYVPTGRSWRTAERGSVSTRLQTERPHFVGYVFAEIVPALSPFVHDHPNVHATLPLGGSQPFHFSGSDLAELVELERAGALDDIQDEAPETLHRLAEMMPAGLRGRPATGRAGDRPAHFGAAAIPSLG